MRNLKKLLAVVVAICVLATFTVPAFAADAKTDAQICTDLGVLKGAGNGVTAEYLATTPDRLQGAIMFLRLKGLEDTAKAFLGTDNFSDVEGLNDTNQAILAYLKANPDLGFEGIGDNKFAPLEKMTAKQYYKVMLVALGYTNNTDFTWANLLSFAGSKGIMKLLDNETFTVNDLAIGTVEALKTAVKGGTDTLIAKLVAGGSITSAAAVASGLYTATPKALEVVSATADNLIVAKIAFNQELDSKTVTNSNISNANVASVSLGDDKKTVFVKLTDKVAQEKTLDFTIENVKSAAGVAITKVVKTVVFRDTTIPVVSGVVAKNAKTLVISASEPMNYDKSTYQQPLNEIKIDGAGAFGTAAVDYVKNTITVKLYTAMKEGTHKIDIADLTDYAGYKAVATTFNVDVAADTKAPALVSAKMNNLREIELTFDEDVEALGTFWVGTTTTSEIPSGNVTQSKTDASKITLKLNSDLDIGAIVEVKIEYKGQKDVNGNEVKDKVLFTGLKATDDTSLPTVTATIGDANKITLTFSKTMYNAGTIKFLKASDNSQMGSVMTVGVTTGCAFKADTNNTVIELKAADTGLTQTDPTDIKVNITGMKDGTVRQNVLAEQNLALKLLDTKTPVIGAYYKTSSTDGDSSPWKKDYVTFYFNKAMNTDTIKSLANYVVQGTTGGALTTIADVSLKEVASDGKSVSFYFPGINNGSYSNALFTIYALKDAAGNSKLVTNDVANGNTLAPFTVVNSALATDKRTIKIEFNRAVGSMDYTGFIAKNSKGDTISYGGTGSISASNPTQASITLYSDLPTDTTGVYVQFTVNAKNCKDMFGNSLKVWTGLVYADPTNSDVAYTAANVVDQIKPEITADAGSTQGSITLKFSEVVSQTVPGLTGLAQDLKINKGNDAVDITTGGKILYFKAGVAANENGFDQIVVTLSNATNYTLSFYNNVVVDGTGNNKVVPIFNKAITTK